MNPDASQYGPLNDLVSAAGALIAAATALRLSFKGRADWEPSEQDVPNGAQKVGGLLTSVAIAILWTSFRSPTHFGLIARLSILSALACLLFLLVYGVLIATLTYEKVLALNAESTATRRIIGGFSLTREGKAARKNRNATVQEVYEGAAYDEDKVWSRLSRALAKMTFVVTYMGLIVSGTIALACASILLGQAVG